MAILRNISGKRFGYWIVEENASGSLWWCRCECGTRKIIRADYLRRGLTKSCGCRGKDWCRTHQMGTTATYYAWAAMIQRCENPKNRFYGSYGGRGITVCAKWRADFRAFLADMGEKPAGRYSIGRIDNNRGYEPSNCEWQTPKQQNRNKRTSRLLTVCGVSKTIAEWAEIGGMSRHRILARLRRGWSPESAVSSEKFHRWNGLK